MSHSVQPPRRQPTRLPHPWDSPGKNTGVGCHCLLQILTIREYKQWRGEIYEMIVSQWLVQLPVIVNQIWDTNTLIHWCTVCNCFALQRAFLLVQLVKNLPANAGDPGSIPGSGRSPGEGNGNPFQYSCLENPKNRGAWQTTVHRVSRIGHSLATKPPPLQRQGWVVVAEPVQHTVWLLTEKFAHPSSTPGSELLFLVGRGAGEVVCHEHFYITLNFNFNVFL